MFKNSYKLSQVSAFACAPRNGCYTSAVIGRRMLQAMMDAERAEEEKL